MKKKVKQAPNRGPRDLVIEVTAYLPDRTLPEKFSLTVTDAAGCKPKSQINQIMLSQVLLEGLRKSYGNKVRVGR